MVNTDAEKRAYQKFISAGMTPEGACGLIGNLEAESDGFYYNRVEYLCIRRLKEAGKTYTDKTYTEAIDSGKISAEEFLHPLPGKQYGYGIAQWTSPTRKAGLYNLMRSKMVSIADESLQITYLLNELEENYQSVLKVLKTTKSIREASDIVLTKFEQPADTGEAMKTSRAARGQKFYDAYVAGKEESMGATAKQIIDTMKSWIGLDRAKGTHKPIVTTYNNYIKAHPGAGRGYQITMKDSYCDATVSAAFIKNNAVDLIGGVECGVEEHIKLFQRAGIWKEDGNLTPEPGWIVCYNWDDTTQPNDGYADHIGVVDSVDKKLKKFTVTEGNISGKVGTRTVSVGWGCIRGFAVPAYAKAVTSTPAKEKGKDGANKASQKASTYTVKKGDTLSEIARRYNTTVQVLVDLNSIANKDVINVGQVIKLPPAGGGFFVGCRVRVSRKADKYATGEAIASFVKGSTYTVKQVGEGRCLLAGILSWVNNEDLTIL